MFDYVLTGALLAVPVLIFHLKTYRRGLVTGLFISLLFWSTIVPAFSLVSLSAALFLFFYRKNPKPIHGNLTYIKKPSTSMLVVFLFSMAVFCAFADAYYNYGSFLRLDPAALTFSRRLSFAAYLLGPLIFGNLCDKKGPFGAGVFLALLAELSVLLAGNGHYSLLLFVMGSFIMQLCISGFFVLMPLLSAAFFGTSQFLRLYPAIAFSTGIFWAFAKYMYQHRWSASSNPGDFLLSLLFLIMISALFVYMAWKRRFVLVQPAQGHSKSV